MKILFLSVICFLNVCGRSSFALLCLSGDSPYQVTMNEEHTKAQVLKNLQAIRFGDLICHPVPGLENVEPGVQCRSLNVADAGFEATFVANQENNISSVSLNELSIAGSRELATLSCFDFSGNRQNRVLWITGENNIEAVQVATGGEIEINIKTILGTGLRWEIKETPSSAAISLLNGPEIVEFSDSINAVGVTRFRFRVSLEPSREFSLAFQLRRPTEGTPIKQFLIKFRT